MAGSARLRVDRADAAPPSPAGAQEPGLAAATAPADRLPQPHGDIRTTGVQLKPERERARR